MTIAERPLNAAPPVVVTALQSTLVELIDLSLQAKQAHWTVAGPLFKPVHEELDILVDIARVGADEVAERIAALGAIPDGLVETVARRTPFEQLAVDVVPTERAVAFISGLIEELTEDMRIRIADLAEPDPVSQGILITIEEQIEKQAWMLRKQIA
jgi:starvation-inducible DNA-binding protein